MELQKHTEKQILSHLTTKGCIESILEHGIIQSEYGDLDVMGNDGKGVYAVLAPKAHEGLLEDLSDFGKNELYCVEFTADVWYECVADGEDGFHVGFVNVPSDVKPEDIVRVYRL